jgi:hypothetical protein
MSVLVKVGATAWVAVGSGVRVQVGNTFSVIVAVGVGDGFGCTNSPHR